MSGMPAHVCLWVEPVGMQGLLAPTRSSVNGSFGGSTGSGFAPDLLLPPRLLARELAFERDDRDDLWDPAADFWSESGRLIIFDAASN